MDVFRIGHGYDVHALAEGRPFIIGGVEIPYKKGFVAHSDGDVAVHAICDALLGAAALGDIGQHFPDTSAAFAGIDSLELLRRTVALLGERAFEVCNVDVTIALEEPKLREYIMTMRTRISDAMNIGFDRVSVKATTKEGLGFTGRGEGAEAHAVALIIEHRAEG